MTFETYSDTSEGELLPVVHHLIYNNSVVIVKMLNLKWPRKV